MSDILDRNEILTTNSVNSHVKDSDGEVFGHVALFDYDMATVEDIREDFGDMEGITLLLESSENKYHVWNLSVRPVDETALTMLPTETDLKHVRSGYRRGFWRLRAGPKYRPSMDVYKGAPELVRMWANMTDRPQSLPHWRVADALHGLPDRPVKMNWVGDACSTTEYRTLTDEMKEEMYPDEQ